MRSTQIFAFVALAGPAAAQSLSASCTSTLAAVATNSDAACLSLASLISLATGGTSSSVVPTIDSWLTSLCGAPACSNATIAAVVQSVTTGCTTDLSSLGITADSAGTLTPLIQQFYPSVRQVVCLKDGNTNCVTETLNGIQSSVGTLSISNIFQTLSNPPSTIPSNVTCSNCVKAAYNIVNEVLPNIVSDAAPSLQSQCGTSFTDGSNPSNIVESASSTTGVAPGGASNTHSAALGAVSLSTDGVLASLGASATILLSTIFVFLA